MLPFSIGLDDLAACCSKCKCTCVAVLVVCVTVVHHFLKRGSQKRRQWSALLLLVPTSNHFRRLLLLLLQLDLPTTLWIVARLEVQTLLHIDQHRLAIKQLATRRSITIPLIVLMADVSLARVRHRQRR